MNEAATEAFLNPRHVGEAAQPSFVGRSASFECGAILRVSLNIDESLHITDAQFKTAGCSVLVAASSLLLDQVIGKTTAAAAALAQSADQFEETMGEVGARRTCLRLVSEALVAAIRSFSNSARDEWEGDEALICTCFCVSERTIEREIQINGLTSIAEVTRACNAGGGCGSCYPLIQEILEEVKSER